MAYATDTRSTNAALKLDISASIYALTQRVANYRAYRKTLNALSDLNSRELADMGLNRSTIRATAFNAVYGTQA